ncbi:MAG: hypothetical protein FOGNACKC_00899 [Anaerolineae bacterium]|nr:hypothetical protein [Anaerolineae bacterium]
MFDRQQKTAVPGWFREWVKNNPDAELALRQALRQQVAERFNETSNFNEFIDAARARRRFIDFVPYTYPQYVVEPFNELVGETLDAVIAGDIRRLMIFAPPQHGKSQLVSVHFPAYWLGHYPNEPVILSSYAGSLAESKSRQTRAIVESVEYRRLFPAVRTNPRSRSVSRWEVYRRRGSLLAVGVGGAITGHGARLGIIDDPFASWADAMRQTQRDRIWDWWRGTFRTRIWENGVIVLIMTRWHQDDLGGRLLNEGGDRWHVLRLPAMAESQEERDQNNKFLNLPLGLLDPLGRKEGEPLAPQRFSAEALAEIRSEVGINAWAAEYQGVPRPSEGSRFKRNWFQIVEEVPRRGERVRFWDRAAGTGPTADYTAGVLICKAEDGLYYIEDVVHGKFSPFEAQNVILQTAQMDADKYNNTVEIWVEQEPGSGGKEAADTITRLLAGFPVKAHRASGSKIVNAEPFAAQAEAGNVRVKRADWNSAYIEEMTAFPFGRNDDQVDATGGAFNKLHKERAFSLGFIG